MEYNSLLCRCECSECKEVLSKDDYFSQGYCYHCQTWRLESEINECEHCQAVRKFELEGMKK